MGLGYASGSLHDFAAAIDYFGRALDIVGGNRYLEGWARHGLGYGCRSVDRFDEAVRHYEQALEIFREIGDLWGQGEALLNLGKTHDEAGSPDAARNCWADALTILEVPRPWGALHDVFIPNPQNGTIPACARSTGAP
jgi:tetratricopeptide (TPR) repeat protein